MRGLLFIVLLIVGFVGPWWLLFLCAGLYAFRYAAYELLLLGFLLDMSYGAGSEAYPVYYTLGAAALIALAAFIKPRLTFYNHASL